MKSLKTITLAIIAIGLLTFAASAQTTLNKVGGGTVDVQAQKDKVVVLAIGASWLPLSAKQAEYNNALVKKYAGRDVVFYFVMTDSTNAKSKNHASDDAMTKFAAANKLTIPILRDSDGAVTLKKFGVDQVPSFLILDKDGSKVEVFGGIDPKYDVTAPISKAIDKLL